MRLHLDTDFAGDSDDACALAMVLGWAGTEITAITTVADPDGVRAGYVRHVLRLVGRTEIPVYAGAGRSLTNGSDMGGVPDHDTFWDVPVEPAPGPLDAAVEAISHSVDVGATVVAIGPYTNLALLERRHPGSLRSARVVLMGGYTSPPEADLPPWDPGMDWNVQCDPVATQTVWDAADDLTLATLGITLRVHLRKAHLDRLTASGPLGELLARQALSHAAEYDMPALGRAHLGLPDDLLNFQYDPLACAVALGWPGARVEQQRLRTVVEDGVLRLETDPGGRATGVVTAVDAEAFEEAWLSAVEAAQRP